MDFMQQALDIARAAALAGEVPVGAVIVNSLNGEVLAALGNAVEAGDPTAHAEIRAIRQAAQTLGTAHLSQCDLYVSLEPCAMCAGAISMARLRRVYFAAYDPKGGAVEHGPRWFEQPTCHHRPEIFGGLYEQESRELLRTFFEELRR